MLLHSDEFGHIVVGSFIASFVDIARSSRILFDEARDKACDKARDKVHCSPTPKTVPCRSGAVFDDGLDLAPHVELVADPLHVGADRFDRDLKFVRDLLVDVAGGEKTEDFVLPRGEFLVLVLDFAVLPEVLGDLSRDVAREGRAS